VFDPQGRFLSKWGTQGTGDGEFLWPRGLAIDGDGNVYVADPADNRIQVFKRVLPSG
jgi:tripartite motif-containing protein 71